MFTNRLVCRLLLLATVVLLGACAAGGDITRPVPSTLLAAPQPAQRLMVILPGRGDSLQGLIDTGIAGVVQQHWPDADVILTGLSMPFYRQGQAVERLHDEVIEPARRPHYKEVWLAGISLGGMGTLLYDRQYPDQIDGLIVLSPYLGQKTIHQEVRKAGGLLAWQPGLPQAIEADTLDRELWRYLKGWTTRPQRTRSIWLAYGADESFRASAELISPLLPTDHVIMLPGGHNWKLWRQAMGRVLEDARPTPR